MFNYQDLEQCLTKPLVYVGDPQKVCFDNAKPIDEANAKSICWIREGQDVHSLLLKTEANTILCSENLTYHSYPDKVIILVDNPRLCFLQLLHALFSKLPTYGIHPTAIIDEKTPLSDRMFIGAHTIIGKCKIGDQSRIGVNCQIHDGVEIGSQVNIMSNCSIGGNGFGYERNADKEFVFFPHLGGVIIGDQVDIGANTCIDRGTLGNTIIGQGTKIDNLVHIAHNVKIGKHCAIIAHALIGGGVVIGDYCWIAPSATIRDGLKIGDHAVVGIGALVLKDIPAHETWIGSPAKRYVKEGG